ncbi:DUF861 domain-containing protein [Paracoccus litorisediminis]|uniref:DUF861 domain-containing protein n=2 Tax=Paracoccaceae TaxID=31989 RepID=A0A844HS71_9RHOB|nr:DUF861 domain-containing protein [Paracoccus litorisediminis]
MKAQPAPQTGRCCARRCQRRETDAGPSPRFSWCIHPVKCFDWHSGICLRLSSHYPPRNFQDVEEDMSHIIRINREGVSNEALESCSVVPAEAVLSGEAIEKGALHLTEGKVTIGTWECTPYAEILAYPNMTEYTTVLSGRVAITDADGTVQEFGPGDNYVLKSGFEGRFEVLETLRKIYVLIED